jgi:hypothetical protein
MYSELTDATNVESYATPEVEQEDFVKCPKCSSKITELDLGSRVLHTCKKQGCGYRKSMPKNSLPKE